MEETFITVATFNKSFEAQLAKNLLENEGIESMLGGAFSSDVLFGSIAAADPIVLQVREQEAQRATSILAMAAAEARLEEDWEKEAEAGVWTCSICGEAISNRLSICYSCQTPKDSIRAATARDSDAIRTDRAATPTAEATQKRDQTARPVAPQRPPSAELAGREEEILELPTAAGDALARKAFLASLFGAMMPLLLPFAWFYLLRAVFYSGETSAKGLRHFYAAMLLNGFVALLVFVLCSSANIFRLGK